MFEMYKTKHFQQRARQRGVREDEADLVLRCFDPDYRGRVLCGTKTALVLMKVLEEGIAARRTLLAQQRKKMH